jgi:hypothetical protein
MRSNEIKAASLKLKAGGPTQAPGPAFNFALISIRDYVDASGTNLRDITFVDLNSL